MSFKQKHLLLSVLLCCVHIVKCNTIEDKQKLTEFCTFIVSVYLIIMYVFFAQSLLLLFSLAATTSYFNSMLLHTWMFGMLNETPGSFSLFVVASSVDVKINRFNLVDIEMLKITRHLEEYFVFFLTLFLRQMTNSN